LAGVGTLWEPLLLLKYQKPHVPIDIDGVWNSVDWAGSRRLPG